VTPADIQPLTAAHLRQAAPSRVVQSILRAHGGLKDDTSIVVVDVMPPGKIFAQCSASARGGGGGCFCT